MKILFIGPYSKIAHFHHFQIRHNLDFQTNRTKITGGDTSDIEHLLVIGHLNLHGAKQILQFDLLHLVIATHQDGNRLAVSQINKCFHKLLGRDIQKLGNGLDLAFARSLYFFHGQQIRSSGSGNLHGPCFFHIGGIAAVLTDNNGILASISQHHEFTRKAAADGAGIRLNCSKFQATAAENTMVGPVHFFIGFTGGLICGVKTVTILHNKFPTTHESESRPDLIPKLGLDLVKIDGQLTVGMDIQPHQISDDLLMGRPQAIFVMMTIGKTQQFRSVFLPAAGLPPEFSGLHHGKQQLLGSGPVHLFTDNPLDFSDCGQPQGKIRVYSRSQFTNKSGPKHKLMADHLGFGRSFF